MLCLLGSLIALSSAVTSPLLAACVQQSRGESLVLALTDRRDRLPQLLPDPAQVTMLDKNAKNKVTFKDVAGCDEAKVGRDRPRGCSGVPAAQPDPLAG